MNSDQSLIILNLVSSYFVIIPIVFGIVYKVRTKPSIKPIFLLLIISLVVEFISTFLSYQNYNNIAIINLFTFVEFLFIVLFYKTFFDAFLKTKIHYVLILLFSLLIIFTTILSNNIKLIDNLSVSIEAILLIFYSLFSLFIIMKNLIYEDLLATPFFWINSAVLIYFSGNLFLFIFSNYLQKHNESSGYLQLYVIHSALNILYYIILSIAFWKARKL